jgi:hypothetical protein
MRSKPSISLCTRSRAAGVIARAVEDRGSYFRLFVM